jgi:hypothetical protein
MIDITVFMKEVGSLRPDKPPPNVKSYVTNEYLKLSDRDPKFKAFAARTN